MFKLDAFGNRIPLRPRLVFNGDGGSGGGGSQKTPQEQGYNFPADTAVAEMEPEQRAEYWRYHSKKHERRADARSDYDEMKAKADKLDALEQENRTEVEKQLDAARDEARREGENLGAERYLKDAVQGRFQALTGKSDDEAATAFAHVDPKSFVGADGTIDGEKVKAFAATFGATNQQPHDPVAAALAAQRRQAAPAGSGGTSLKERREATRERLSGRNKSKNQH